VSSALGQGQGGELRGVEGRGGRAARGGELGLAWGWGPGRGREEGSVDVGASPTLLLKRVHLPPPALLVAAPLPAAATGGGVGGPGLGPPKAVAEGWAGAGGGGLGAALRGGQGGRVRSPATPLLLFHRLHLPPLARLMAAPPGLQAAADTGGEQRA
jgi:hypothetical protein